MNHSLARPPMSRPGSPTNVTLIFFLRSCCLRASCETHQHHHVLHNMQRALHNGYYNVKPPDTTQRTSLSESCTMWERRTVRLRKSIPISGTRRCCTRATRLLCTHTHHHDFPYSIVTRTSWIITHHGENKYNNTRIALVNNQLTANLFRK